jgi:trehalose 6-phosphate phosphatase
MADPVIGGDDFALFLDFDGTLVEIAERPDEVVVDPELPGVLSRLRARLGGALALVSGRPISFLDARFAPHVFDAAGLHGIEHRLGARVSGCRAEDHPALRAAIDSLKETLTAHPDILVEDKGCSVAIHWRLAPHEAELAQATAVSLVEALGAGYRIQFGKAVAEILPATAGKGRIIQTFLESPPYRGRRAVFMGDDLTDEHGFEAVNARGGVSVRVGGGETAATTRIGSPAALRHMLAAWADGEPWIPAGVAA